MPSEPPGQNWSDEITWAATSSVASDISPLCRRAYPAASPAIARAMCVVSRGNWNSRESFRPRMPVYFRRVQENHFWKSDRILNVLTEAKSQKKHALEVMCPTYRLEKKRPKIPIRTFSFGSNRSAGRAPGCIALESVIYFLIFKKIIEPQRTHTVRIQTTPCAIAGMGCHQEKNTI